MVKAYVLANCEAGAEKHVIDELKTIPCVKEAHGILGAYDIVAEIESSSREELNKVIALKIRKIHMIKSTLTLVGIDGQNHSTY
jgi:DNA-binding Lrp family transcriptional regulator